jgi:two-component system, cell cycle response regulator
MATDRFRETTLRLDEPMSLELLLRVLRGHEPGLGDHVDSVCEHAVELGRRLIWPEEDIDDLYWAAQLHDVGKIAISREVLNKRGPLNAAEWALMRRHTLIGETLIGVVPGMRQVGRLVRSSHERWDGDGYPDGLRADAIPRGSQIIFIADSFDAMTSRRPYKSPMSTELALEEIGRCAGTQFDPDLADEFVDLVAAESRLQAVG